MSGHTPGPWIIEAENPRDIISDVYDVEICNIQPVDVGGPKNFNYGAQTVANANLIMAAPDLLAALEAVVDISTRNPEVWDLAFAAISKAKGLTSS